ncbi:MAG: DUF4177 domain-containing protein [Coriobacteriales bacterium]|jgi:hypothetical protein|nr:DUF4177 domain-containing protein [Coriobacteriales bacterium]
MKYEYKVITPQQFNKHEDIEMMHLGWGPVEEIEKAINKLANEGWEYLNPIVFPYTTDGKWLAHTRVHLVFRREKS